MRDLANLDLRVGLGVLADQVGTREASTAIGAFREVRRTVVEGQKIGYEKHVLDGGDTADSRESRHEALARRKAELQAELEAVTEELAA